MGFTDYIYATIQNLKCSLQVGLNAFFDTHKGGQIACSKQAFSKGRQRIKPEAFRTLFQSVVGKFYEEADLTSWKGYQLFGIDGTRLKSPLQPNWRSFWHPDKSGRTAGPSPCFVRV